MGLGPAVVVVVGIGGTVVAVGLELAEVGTGETPEVTVGEEASGASRPEPKSVVQKEAPPPVTSATPTAPH